MRIRIEGEGRKEKMPARATMSIDPLVEMLRTYPS